MTESSWKDNEVAASYERNFALLEAARREYGEAISSFFDDLQKDLQLKELNEGDWPLRVDFVREGQGFESLVRGTLRHVDISTGLSVVVRAGAPFGSPPATLQLGAAYTPNGETVATSLESMRRFVAEAESTETVALEPNWLFAEECPIPERAMFVETMMRFSKRLVPYALRLRDEISSFNKVIRVFETVFSRLRMRDGFGTPTKVSFPRTLWSGMRYVEVEFVNHPRFWVGYHIAWGTLMYGHHDKQGDPGFAERFFTEIGAAGRPRHDRYPAGTLLDMAGVRRASPEELEVICLETFGRYLAFARDYDAGPTSPAAPLPHP